MSNIFISPVFAKETDETSLDKRVNLYLPESTDDLTIYEDEGLEDELTRVKNNSRAVLLEELGTEKVSLVEIETSNNEVVQGYINSEVVVDREDIQEEYKVYAEEENKDIPMYIDETLDELLIDLEEGTSVFVNEVELTETTEEYIYVSLNEEIPEELEAELEDKEVVEGFVHVDRLVALDKEDEFLLKRENDTQEDATNDEQDNEFSDESEIAEDNISEESNEENVEEEPKNDEQSNEEEKQSDSEEAQSDDKSDDEATTEETEEEKEEQNKEKLEEEKENNEISTFASKPQTSSTSRLGHIRGGDRPIYKELGGKSFKATSKYQNQVYYIKRQAKMDGNTYYLLSDQPSATKGVVGWMKASDVSTHSHTGVTKKSNELLLNGKGKATSKAWGGDKDAVHKSLKNFEDTTLHVNLTEKVGKNTWYRGKINNQGENVWVHSSQTKEKPQIKQSKTSKLGHIRGGHRLIYKSLGGKSVKATAKHRDAVYYIKQQATFGSDTYYLLSTQPSAKNGVIGWMKASDLSTHSHTGVSKKSQNLLINGKGKATSKAWGGSKDTVHSSMKSFEGEFLNVNLTEKVGNNTWYRGKINNQGDNIWLHSSQTDTFNIKKSSTSRLGHIRGGDRLMYKDFGGEAIKATAKYQNAVYYIKEKATLDSETFYLLSTEPSAKRGVVGWMNSKDLSTHSHTGVSKKSDQMVIKGTGKGTSKAWGGSKDTVHLSMKSFTGDIFDINLTEKVGKNTWYRGKINSIGQNVWLHSSHVVKDAIKETNYKLPVSEAVAIQMKRSPFVMNGSHGFVAKSRVNSNLKMKAGSTNVRTMPTTVSNRDNNIIKKLQGGTKIKPIAEVGKWYAIEVGGSRKTAALPQQVEQSLDPDNHLTDEVNKFQFLDLRKRTGLTTNEMNRELRTRGILKGEGKAFREASLKHGVNEMYLIVHARLETGNGTSALSNGTHEVGLDQNGKPQLVEGAADRVRLTNIKKTYNMFGIGAIDSDPARGGAVRAYEEGWFTPHDAIVGGAHWIKDNYIYNQYNQNTIYKMRWKPEMVNGAAWKQYATDIEWAIKQARLIHSVYNKTDQNKVLSFDRPIYK